ncbi:MAG: hypothetical protein AB2814_11455, partial [Candidatus Sedimenticola endophacoides]
MASVLSLGVAAVLCGMRGYKDITIWVQSLGQKARSHGKSTLRKNSHYVASRYASFSKYRIPPG